MKTTLVNKLWQDEKSVLIIDGANLYSTCQVIGKNIDFNKMLDYFEANTKLVRALYYTALLPREEQHPVRKLVDFLDYNGYSIVSKEAKTMNRKDGEQVIKGNTDVEIAVDILKYSTLCDHIYLFSGDGDFTYAVDAAKNNGCKITVVSVAKMDDHPETMASDELRRVCDEFVCLDKIIGNFERK